VKQAVERFAPTALFAAALLLTLGCEEPTATPAGLSVLDVQGYNMDGVYNADLHIVSRTPNGDTIRDTRIRMIVHSYGPATEALQVPMLALPDKLATDLEYEEPFDTNYVYYRHTKITGELTREGGFFATHFDHFAAGETTWEEHEWTLTNLEQLPNPDPRSEATAAPVLEPAPVASLLSFDSHSAHHKTESGVFE